jgi:beta-phosphoglucomutase-like phosphatase (HAD superfamily)
MDTAKQVVNLLRYAKLVFWDFDGVIKESINVKTDAFVKLFESYGPEIMQKVKLHHEANGGMSRFKKIPIYLEMIGIAPTKEKIDDFCEAFAAQVVKGVINADWVPGAENYIRSNQHEQLFILVSATPQEELRHIIDAISLTENFKYVFGAPISKSDAIRAVLQELAIKPDDTIFIGDATTDRDAACDNNVPFLLRRHETNVELFDEYIGPSIYNFENL